ncbi:nad kinase [Anaeramoeba flamelloides]|uniref:Nad kinase n=1 Tax=Anaeramoeba flamelloides TaxID=1746091 RepID=A0AAV7YCB4_9EUKA|nr:nad kinase [Anaeramoeba flamelloides]
MSTVVVNNSQAKDKENQKGKLLVTIQKVKTKKTIQNDDNEKKKKKHHHHRQSKKHHHRRSRVHHKRGHNKRYHHRLRKELKQQQKMKKLDKMEYRKSLKKRVKEKKNLVLQKNFQLERKPLPKSKTISKTQTTKKEKPKKKGSFDEISSPKVRINVIKTNNSKKEKSVDNYFLRGNDFIHPLSARNELKLDWKTKPKTVLLIKQRGDTETTKLMSKMLKLLTFAYQINVLIEPSAKEDFPDYECFDTNDKPNLYQIFDFVISLGGNGTFLYTVSLFNLQPVPPLLGFSVGSLRFLTNYDSKNFRKSIKAAIQGKFFLTLRSRLVCRIFSDDELVFKTNILNEAVIDRSGSSRVVNLKCYCDNVKFTTISADGVLVSTPTGSTGYNISAGGPITHPAVSGILFTPMCAHSLSARPLLFPDSVVIKIKVAKDSNGICYCTFDGKQYGELKKGMYLTITTSKYPVPSINVNNSVADWFQAISTILGWNERKIKHKPYEED